MHFILSLLKLCAKTHLNLNYFIFNGYFDSLALFSYNNNRVLCWKMFSIVSFESKFSKWIHTPTICALIFLFFFLLFLLSQVFP